MTARSEDRLSGSARATWVYGPADDPRMGTYWRATSRFEDGRISDASGLAGSPRAARRAIRKALRKARRNQP